MIALSSRDPGLYLAVDGEMQADAAMLKSLIKKESSSLLHRAARARKCVNFLRTERGQHLLRAVGQNRLRSGDLADPGGNMAEPVRVPQGDSDVSEIVDTAVIAALDAQERAPRGAGAA